MTTVSQIYPSPWLKADDLAGSVTVKIAKVAVEEFRQRDGEKESRIVLSFSKDGKPTKKKLICNKTQALAVAQLTKTEEFEKWQGREITLRPATLPNGKATISIAPESPSPKTGAKA